MAELSEFEKCWERVREMTGWENYKDLATFLDISGSSVSGTKKRGKFPIEWAYKLATHYEGSTDWILQGRGPMWLSNKNPNREEEAHTCDCSSPNRMINQAKILTLGSESPPDFDILNHILNEINELRSSASPPLPDSELQDILMIIYSFCQPENRTAAELICSVTLSWLATHQLGNHE